MTTIKLPKKYNNSSILAIIQEVSDSQPQGSLSQAKLISLYKDADMRACDGDSRNNILDNLYHILSK